MRASSDKPVGSLGLGARSLFFSWECCAYVQIDSDEPLEDVRSLGVDSVELRQEFWLNRISVCSAPSVLVGGVIAKSLSR